MEALAVKCEVSLSSIVQWESGRVTPRRKKIDILDVELGAEGQLLAAYGYMVPLSIGFDGELPPEISVLPTKVERLEAEVSRLDGLVNALALRLESALEDALKARQDSPAASKPKRAAPGARRSVG